MNPEEESLTKLFPNLSEGSFHQSSERAPYNCFAWAVNLTDRRWGTDGAAGDYWPAGVPREDTLAGFVASYRTVGFSVCDDGELEADFEKIALYVGAGGVLQHAARQLPSGAWTSKIGWLGIDIEHATLQSLEGDEYGVATVFLRRPR